MLTNLPLKTYLACKRLQSDIEGATMIEYSVLIGLITAAVIVTIGLVGGYVETNWTTLETNMAP